MITSSSGMKPLVLSLHLLLKDVILLVELSLFSALPLII